MKKVIIVICLIVFFYLFLNKDEEQIRIRVIANSDDSVDQEIKGQVVKYLYSNYNLDFSSIEECDIYLINNIDAIKEDLVNEFKDIKVTYENHNFYNKTYNNIVSKNENYKTLLIEIREAKGENFWGVLYSNEFIENENTIKYNSYIIQLFKKGE
ncbi:MAG: stage II sporulation protein R [bacterium]